MLHLEWKILIFFLIFMSVFGLSAANAMELNKENGQKLISPDFDGVKSTENPSDINVMALGQMGGNLHPNNTIELSLTSDTQLSKSGPIALNQDNYAFSMAMNEWNVHDYKKAYKSFDRYLEEFPQGKWIGEAILHQGCEARFNGRYREAGDKLKRNRDRPRLCSLSSEQVDLNVVCPSNSISIRTY